VFHKERSLEDASNHLKSFMSDRVWTEALNKLLDKVAAPPEEGIEMPDDGAERLCVSNFHPIGNELMQLEEAQKAFKNLRRILDL
jgi:hypothetical protein